MVKIARAYFMGVEVDEPMLEGVNDMLKLFTRVAKNNYFMSEAFEGLVADNRDAMLNLFGEQTVAQTAILIIRFETEFFQEPLSHKRVHSSRMPLRANRKYNPRSLRILYQTVKRAVEYNTAIIKQFGPIVRTMNEEVIKAQEYLKSVGCVNAYAVISVRSLFEDSDFAKSYTTITRLNKYCEQFVAMMEENYLTFMEDDGNE